MIQVVQTEDPSQNPIEALANKLRLSPFCSSIRGFEAFAVLNLSSRVSELNLNFSDSEDTFRFSLTA